METFPRAHNRVCPKARSPLRLRCGEGFGVASGSDGGRGLLVPVRNCFGQVHDVLLTHDRRAAALIAVAIDLRRAGFAAPLPTALLEQTHAFYLEERGGARLNPESEEQAWQWATRITDSGIAPLHTADGETYEVFDYLVDTMNLCM